MLRVSKVLVLSLLVVAMCSPMAMATTSRVQALAGTSSYINDDSDIFRWYGTLPSYSKMVMAEVGQSSVAGSFGDVSVDYQALGFTHNWGEDSPFGTWAVFLLMNSVEDGSFYLFNPLGTPGAGSTLGLSVPSTKFVLAWGTEVEMLSIGLMFTRSDVMIEEPATGKNDLAFTTLGGGLRVDLADELYADGAFTVGWAGGDTLGGWDKGVAFNLEGRAFWEILDDATVVPHFGYRAYKFALEDPLAPHGDEWSDIVVGASFNFDVNTNNMLIFATELEWVNWKYAKADGDRSEVDVQVLPQFYLALESDVTSWFTARVGATKMMSRVTVKDAVGDESTYTNFEVVPFAAMDDFEFYLGGGFHIGEWDIDAVFSHELPFRMGYWLTGYGAGDSDPPVMRASATYRF
ncbi:MAG: hypothetical protein JSW58_17265 [Candidatus Latescibacterota bacterium]|nr:MAG: hypothetical protein JSW58_17265 [Candidatus Latescibacterota bacterium]